MWCLVWTTISVVWEKNNDKLLPQNEFMGLKEREKWKKRKKRKEIKVTDLIVIRNVIRKNKRNKRKH